MSYLENNSKKVQIWDTLWARLDVNFLFGKECNIDTAVTNQSIFIFYGYNEVVVIKKLDRVFFRMANREQKNKPQAEKRCLLSI